MILLKTFLIYRFFFGVTKIAISNNKTTFVNSMVWLRVLGQNPNFFVSKTLGPKINGHDHLILYVHLIYIKKIFLSSFLVPSLMVRTTSFF